MLRRRALASLVFVLVGASAAIAQQRALTLDDIYDPLTRLDFTGNAPSLSWIDAARYAWAKPAGQGRVDWMSVEASSGNAQPLYDAAKMQAALSKVPGVSTDEAARMEHARTLVFD